MQDMLMALATTECKGKTPSKWPEKLTHVNPGADIVTSVSAPKPAVLLLVASDGVISVTHSSRLRFRGDSADGHGIRCLFWGFRHGVAVVIMTGTSFKLRLQAPRLF